MDDKTPTRLPAEGEGTPALPADGDLAPPADGDSDELPPFDPQLPAATEQG